MLGLGDDGNKYSLVPCTPSMMAPAEAFDHDGEGVDCPHDGRPNEQQRAASGGVTTQRGFACHGRSNSRRDAPLESAPSLNFAVADPFSPQARANVRARFTFPRDAESPRSRR